MATSTNGAEKRAAANTSSPSPSPVPKKVATLPKDDDYVGSWLCERGPYQEYIEALCGSNPSLKKPDPANKDKPLKPGNAKVALLDASAIGHPKFDRVEFSSNGNLKRYLDNTDDTHSRRRIYIMEGLAQDYVATLGGHFFMDPSFFQRQERTCVWSNEFTPTSDALPQPSILNPEKSFHLQYCELRQFDHPLPNTFFFCKRTGRHVGRMTTARINEKSTISILRRKISWWSRKTTGGGWDVVILCDPQLRDLSPEPQIRNVSLIKNTPFQDGYVDFVPPPTPERAKTLKQHPHSSMLEDMCHYLENYSHLLDESAWETPSMSSLFLKKMVAAYYLQLIDYIKAMLPSLELKLTTAWVDEQEQWRSLQTISRRCGNYRDDIEDTLLSLGYPLETLESSKTVDWRDCQKDFQYIYFRLKVLKQRADTLMQAMTGLASIAGNRQSLEEAKRVKRLTLLGLLFIPLAYTASLFSMQDNYAPNKPQFWVYWASALGLVAVTFLLTWLLDSALDEEAQWKTRWLKVINPFSKEKLEHISVKRSKTIYGWK